MPKRSRQAHLPQQTRKRKPRRSPLFTPEDVYLAPSSPGVAPGVDSPPSEAPSAARRAEGGRASDTLAFSRLPGQLPTFERAYLVDELRRIVITAGSLLILIVVLTLVLR